MSIVHLPPDRFLNINKIITYNKNILFPKQTCSTNNFRIAEDYVEPIQTSSTGRPDPYSAAKAEEAFHWDGDSVCVHSKEQSGLICTSEEKSAQIITKSNDYHWEEEWYCVVLF